MWDDFESEKPVRDASNGDLDTEADAMCPYCGEWVTLALDPGGARRQTYEEDCFVCCRPWIVRVAWDEDGLATVALEREDGD